MLLVAFHQNGFVYYSFTSIIQFCISNSYSITLVEKKNISLPVKLQGDSYSFDIAESEYDYQIALSPANVKRGGIKLKNYVCNKSKPDILVCNYKIQCQNVNSVTIYVILTTKNLS